MKKFKRIFLITLVLLLGSSVVLDAQSMRPVLFNLRDIRDVSRTLPTDGQILTFVAATRLWTPMITLAGPHAMSTHTDDDTYNINTTGTLNVDTNTLSVGEVAGKVGIGTITPAALLHLVGNDVNQVGLTVTNDEVGGNDYMGIFVGGGTASGITSWMDAGVIEAAVAGGLTLGSYANAMKFYAGSGRVPQMVLNTDGELAIVSQYGTMQTATGDGTTTVDWGLGNIMYFTFGTQNDAFTFTPPANKGDMKLIIKQDGTGSRTMDWSGVTVLWPGDVEPTLSTGANAVDVVTFIYDGTSYLGLFNGDFR